HYKIARKHFSAKQSLRAARILDKWYEAESAGIVRLQALLEQENYFDVYGKPDSEREYKAMCEALDRNGCYCVVSQYFDGREWQWADSVGMCVYDRPLDPFCNDYVIDLMQSALDQVPQQGEH